MLWLYDVPMVPSGREEVLMVRGWVGGPDPPPQATNALILAPRMQSKEKRTIPCTGPRLTQDSRTAYRNYEDDLTCFRAGTSVLITGSTLDRQAYAGVRSR